MWWYYNKKKLEVDTQILQYRTKLIKGVEELALECAKQRGEYEHTWHSKQEELNTEIAKIEASKEAMTKDIDNLNALLLAKDKEIERLNNICLQLAKAKVVIAKK